VCGRSLGCRRKRRERKVTGVFLKETTSPVASSGPCCPYTQQCPLAKVGGGDGGKATEYLGFSTPQIGGGGLQSECPLREEPSPLLAPTGLLAVY
jgi:hypothetical protein